MGRQLLNYISVYLQEKCFRKANKKVMNLIIFHVSVNKNHNKHKRHPFLYNTWSEYCDNAATCVAHFKHWLMLFHHLVLLYSFRRGKVEMSILSLTPAVHIPSLPNATCLPNNVFFPPPTTNLRLHSFVHSFPVTCEFQQKNS